MDSTQRGFEVIGEILPMVRGFPSGGKTPMRCQVLAASLAMIFCLIGQSAQAYDLTITGGTVHRPGPMPDTPLPEGKLGSIVLDNELGGASEFFNNGTEPPNVPGELEIYGHLAGELSNGAPFNEHVYGGVVSIGQGALKMLSVIAGDGDMKGRETYRLDERFNWIIHTDLALDAGFPQGLVMSRNITITSGVLLVAPSLQTEAGLKGGINEAGSIPSGAPIYGMLGDMDNRGFLDGRIVGVGRVPLGFMFVPGSPLVMQRNFKSNIPVTREEAESLRSPVCSISATSWRSHGMEIPRRAPMLLRTPRLTSKISRRARGQPNPIFPQRSPARTGQAAQAARIEALLKQESHDTEEWLKAGVIPAASMAAIDELLKQIDQAMPALRAGLHFTRVGG